MQLNFSQPANSPEAPSNNPLLMNNLRTSGPVLLDLDGWCTPKTARNGKPFHEWYLTNPHDSTIELDGRFQGNLKVNDFSYANADENNSRGRFHFLLAKNDRGWIEIVIPPHRVGEHSIDRYHALQKTIMGKPDQGPQAHEVPLVVSLPHRTSRIVQDELQLLLRPFLSSSTVEVGLQPALELKLKSPVSVEPAVLARLDDLLRSRLNAAQQDKLLPKPLAQLALVINPALHLPQVTKSFPSSRHEIRQ